MTEAVESFVSKDAVQEYWSGESRQSSWTATSFSFERNQKYGRQMLSSSFCTRPLLKSPDIQTKKTCDAGWDVLCIEESFLRTLIKRSHVIKPDILSLFPFSKLMHQYGEFFLWGQRAPSSTHTAMMILKCLSFIKKNPKQFLFWRPESPLCAWRPPRNTDEHLLGRISGNLSTGSSFVEYISKIQAKYVFKNIYILALRSDNSKFH